MREGRRGSLSLLLGAALALGCAVEVEVEEAAGVPVVMVGVAQTHLRERIEATGELRAREEAVVAAEIGALVTAIRVDEGQAAEAAQVVIELDPERRELELADARARLAEARAALEEQRREHERVRTLRERDIASQAQLDQAETQLALARSRHAAAQAQVGVAERVVRDATVRAPFAGLVARRLVSRGEYVHVGQPLFEIVTLDPIEVEFHVAERDSARVAHGQEVSLSVTPYPDERFGGQVTMIAPTIDPRTRTLRVKAQIDNEDDRLRPGLFARVDLGIAVRPDVLMVPEEAVLLRSDGEVVFRATRGDRVQRVRVSTGVHRDGMVEVASGLAPGDVVVTRGHANLIDGALVSPRNPDGTPLRTELSAAEAAPVGP